MKKNSKKFKRFRVLFQKNKRFRTITVTFGLIFAALFLVVFSFLMIRFETSGKVTAAISVEPETLDPTFCSDTETETVLANCFEGLMRIDEDGNAVKAAASEYTLSEDGLVYTFTVSSDSRWSDGTAVEASDFVYAWQRTANPYNNSQYAYLFENIVGYDKILEDFEKENNGQTDEEGNYITMDMSDLWVKAADSRTLVVKLKKRDSAFLQKCAMTAFFPLCEDSVKPNTRIWSTDPKAFVSNGAFVLKSWTGGSYLELSPNENFREREKVSLKSIKFFFISDGDEAVKKFKKSTVLFSDVLPEDSLEKTSKNKQYNSYEELGAYFLYFNLNKKPFDDVRVREALTLAIDREKLIEDTAVTRGVAADALISNGFSCFREGGNNYFDTRNTKENIKRAKELLKAAGYEDGKNFPKFEYLFNDNTFSRETAEIIVQMWKDNLGIECTLKSVSWSKFEEMRNRSDFDVAKGGLLAPYNDVAFMLENFTSENNFCGWENKEYDSLVSQMINSQTENAHSAEKILMDDWVICPLYYYADGYLASKRIKNYYVSNTGVAYFAYAEVNVF